MESDPGLLYIGCLERAFLRSSFDPKRGVEGEGNSKGKGPAVGAT